MSDSVKNILENTRYLLKTPNRWIKDDLANTEAGLKTQPGSPYAVKWCLVGALTKASMPYSNMECLWDAMTLLKDITGASLLTQWNDDKERTHEDVMDAFDKAIGSI